MTFNWLFFVGGRVTRLLPASSPGARLSFLSLWKDTSQKSQWRAITGRKGAPEDITGDVQAILQKQTFHVLLFYLDLIGF